VNVNSEIAKRRSTASTSVVFRDYLVMQPLIQWMETVGRSYASGVLVDFGCGNKPYKAFLLGIQKYIGVDVEQNDFGTVDVMLESGKPLPMENESVDTVLSTQVLEHVPDPQAYLNEASRILKRGGSLILTCPGAYMLHEEPRDYFRYTQFGLQHLVEASGLKIVRMDPAGGAWRLLGQTFLNHKTFGARRRIPILSNITYSLTVIMVNIVASLLDKWNTNTKDTVNYMVVAKK
jgi:SAM-dependent methyltransferase